MAKYDVEQFEDDMLALVKSNISAKVAEINAEKGDDMLQAPRDDQYINNYSRDNINKDFWIYYAVVQSEPIAQAGASLALEVTMDFYIAFCNVNNDGAAQKKTLRYIRALSEIFQSNYRKHAEISALKITSHFGGQTRFENNRNWYKIGAVELKGTIIQ